jgi:hypothetical protein
MAACLGIGQATALGLPRLIPQQGSDASYVLAPDGVLWAWGANYLGQLGDGTLDDRMNAEPVEFPAGVTSWESVTAGVRVFAVDQRGRLFGWGGCEQASGTGAIRTQSWPVQLGEDYWVAAAPFTFLSQAVGDPAGLGLDAFGRLHWLRLPPPTDQGIPPFARFFTEPADTGHSERRFVAISATGQFALALTDDGRLFVAGRNPYQVHGPNGFADNHDFDRSLVEIPPPASASRWESVTAGPWQACGLADDGELYVWGRQDVTDGNATVFLAGPWPRLIARPDGVTRWRKVVVGDQRSWHDVSNNFWSLLGDDLRRYTFDGQRAVFAPSPHPEIRDAAIGAKHLLLLGGDGKVYVRGANDRAQLGRFGPGSDDYSEPAGEADFLRGTRELLPVLHLELIRAEAIEPRSPEDPGADAIIRVVRTGREDVELRPGWRLERDVERPLRIWRLRTTGTLGPGESDADWIYSPLYLETHHEDFECRFGLIAAPWYELSSPSVVTFFYRHTPPENFAPGGWYVWPRQPDMILHHGVVEFVVYGVDPDGYVARVDFYGTLDHNEPEQLLGTGIGMPVAAGETNLIRFALTNPPPWIFFRADLVDDRGRVVVGRYSFHLDFIERPPARLRFGPTGPEYPLFGPATSERTLWALQASTNLIEWQNLTHFDDLLTLERWKDPDAAPAEFYRLANPEMTRTTEWFPERE